MRQWLRLLRRHSGVNRFAQPFEGSCQLRVTQAGGLVGDRDFLIRGQRPGGIG